MTGMQNAESTESTKTPLNVFPLEIWELILEQIADTNDVINLFETCPQLKVLVHEKQFSWLIGQVMPLILSKFLWNKDIIACRLVSKSWNNAIATSLENHPDHQPYKKVSQQQGITEHHFMYHSRPKVCTSFHRLMISEWAASAPTPCKTNPFLGRTVSIVVDSTNGRERRHHCSTVNLSEAVPTFKKFGQHISHITFDLYGSNTEKAYFLTNVIPSMFQCLSHLPNLKSLKMKSYNLKAVFGSDEDFSLDESSLAPFPAYLETLDLIELKEISQTFYETLIKLLVNHNDLKKLAINVEKWNKAHGALFPHLTELWVYLGYHVNDPELEDVLREMKCPKLKKLRVYFLSYEVNELLKAVEPYQIEVLEIGGTYFDDYCFDENVSLPSVRDCKVNATPYAKFKFLKALPSLEYLTVDVSHVDDPPPGDYSDSDEEEDEEEDKQTFCKCLRKIVKEDSRGPYNFDSIWDDLPSLQVFTWYANQYVRGYPGRTFKSFGTEPIHDFCIG